MEYNEEQEKEYISRESLNRLCKEAQELRWYKRYRSGASKAWLASCYIGGCFAGIQMLKPWETANASFGRALLEYGAVILSGLLFGAGFYLLSYFVYMFSAAMKIPPKVLVKQDSPLQSFCFCSFPFLLLCSFSCRANKNIV